MEPREVDKKSLPGRSRYYSAMLDSRILESGKDYDTIPKLMTIFVLSYDPFDMGCMIYEARTSIAGKPEIPYDDGIRRLYFYTDGELEEGLGAYGLALKNLLKYIRNSRDVNVVDDTTKRIDSIVRDTKERKEVSLEYMKRWELDRIIREEGREEGREETNTLYRWLFDGGRMEDLRRAMDDEDFCRQLEEEMSSKTAVRD